MQLELIYYASARNAALEQELETLGITQVRESDDRRSFLTQLADALQKSGVVLAVGRLSDLAEALIKGLGLPATPVDWAALGMEEKAETVLPQGALPLLVGGKVDGMLLESGPQAILAVDEDPDAVAALYTAYLAPYFQALGGVTPEENPVPAAAEEPTPEPEPQAEAETEANPEPESEPVPDPAASGMKAATPEYDIFADMEDVDFEEPDEKPRKKHRWWIPVVCLLLAAVLAGSGYWYLVLRDGGAEGYYSALMKENYGETGDSQELDETFSSQYLTRFGRLYQINGDVIAALTADGLGIDLPVVCAAEKEDFYRFHRFDGSLALYGTPYVASPYSEADVHPNLVIRGDRLLRPLNSLLTKGVGSVNLTTDSILYGKDEWQIFSVMVLDDAAVAEFDSTFADLTAEQRQTRAKKALSLTKVETGLTAAELEDVDLSDNFLTLLTPCTSEKGKTLAVMARRVVEETSVILTDPADPTGVDLPDEPLE